jgi:hypothetical protein
MEISTLTVFFSCYLSNLKCCRIALRDFIGENPMMTNQTLGLVSKLQMIKPIAGSEVKAEDDMDLKEKF